MPEYSTSELITRDDVMRWLQRHINAEDDNGVSKAYWGAVRDWTAETPDTVGNVWHWAWLLNKLRAVWKNGRGRA